MAARVLRGLVRDGSEAASWHKKAADQGKPTEAKNALERWGAGCASVAHDSRMLRARAQFYPGNRQFSCCENLNHAGSGAVCFTSLSFALWKRNRCLVGFAENSAYALRSPSESKRSCRLHMRFQASHLRTGSLASRSFHALMPNPSSE